MNPVEVAVIVFLSLVVLSVLGLGIWLFFETSRFKRVQREVSAELEEMHLQSLRNGNPISILWETLRYKPHQVGEMNITAVCGAFQEAQRTGQLTREQVIELVTIKEEK